MNISNACIALVLLSTMGGADAFLPTHNHRAMIPAAADTARSRPVNTRVYMGTAEEEVAALRAKAQEMREEAQRLAKVRCF